MKKIFLLILILIIAIPVLSGCTDNDNNRTIIIKGIEKQKEIETTSYNGSLVLKLDFDGTNNSLMTSYLQALSSLEFNFSGVEEVSSKHSEMGLNAKAMDLSFDIPIIFKDNVAYIKIPDNFSTLLQMEDKEYIAIDLSQSNEESRQDNAFEEKIDVIKSLVNSIDETAIVREDSAKYSLENGTVGEVISINISQDNYKQILDNMYSDALPNIIGQLERYSVTDSQKEQTEQLKEKLSSEEEFNSLINDLESKLLINSFKLTNVYDNNGYQRRTILFADLDIYVDELGLVGIEINYDLGIDEINKDVQFNLPLPSQGNIKAIN